MTTGQNVKWRQDGSVPLQRRSDHFGMGWMNSLAAKSNGQTVQY